MGGVNLKEVTKFIVSDGGFQDAIHLPCYKISYIDSINIESITLYDFILISDKNGNEIVRNFLNAEEKILEYTSCFHGSKCDNISLTVIMTLLYQSIMWIRHGTYVKKKFFWHRDFPVKRLEREMYFIESILKLCESEINMKNFINVLEEYKNNTEEFSYCSAFDILDRYTWQFELTNLRKEKIEVIKNSLSEMSNLLKDKSSWKEIYKVGYRIHNEPYFIYENTDKF